MSDPAPCPGGSCPLPLQDYPAVTLAHGGGGRLMNVLIGNLFHAAFGNEYLRAGHDGSVLPLSGKTAITTDSFVVHPLRFPGGDIGKLAVCGTVNDLAMCGARPRFLSAAFILEEGLAMETLWSVACSMSEAARASGVEIVTGDTKVVDRGKGDGIFITTTGVGEVLSDPPPAPGEIRPGDAILLSGDLGRHGIAIMAAREGLAFESELESDCAPLWKPVQGLIEAGIPIRVLRDLTRGGLSSALNEIASTARRELRVEAAAIPVCEAVQGACEMLGLDPHYVANEGRFIAVVPEEAADAALDILRAHPESSEACGIGRVGKPETGRVLVRSDLGIERVMDMLSGEQLPRIC